MHRRITGICICMLLLIPVLSTPTIANQEPKLEIEIHGRSTFIFGPILIIEIKNTGDADAQNVDWSSRLKHPLFKFLGLPPLELEDTIDMIKAGETEVINVGLGWIGRIEITVTACVSDEDPVTKTVNGFIILGIIVIFPE